MKIDIYYRLLVVAFIYITTASCNNNRSGATLGGSRDNSNVNGTGNQSITDTATINQIRRDSAKTKPADSTSKGNANPTGHTAPANGKP